MVVTNEHVFLGCLTTTINLVWSSHCRESSPEGGLEDEFSQTGRLCNKNAQILKSNMHLSNKDQITGFFVFIGGGTKTQTSALGQRKGQGHTLRWDPRPNNTPNSGLEIRTSFWEER